MNPVFIYFNEVKLREDNKFVLDFSNEKRIQKINFSPNYDCYICSLNCNISGNNQTYLESKEKLINNLSKKSSALITKGADYQNEVGDIQSALTDNFHIPNIAPLTYKFVLDPKVLENNTFKYKFYNVSDQKIYSPFSHFKNNGFLFRGVGTAASANTVSIEFVDDYKKIKTTFFQDDAITWAYGNNLYRDLNVKLVRNKKGNNFKWYGTNPKLVYRAAGYAMDVTSFRASEFFKYFYVDKKLGKDFYVVGTPLQRFFLPNIQKHLQPFIQHANRIEI